MNALWFSNLEVLLVEKHADIRREIEQIRLEVEAERTKPCKASLLGRGMSALSTWLVSTGEHLHRRYNDPAPLPSRYQSLKIAR